MMANYTKTVDPNHMVTVGYEGFWGEYDADVQYNPGNGWAGITGQNFSRNMAHVEIDFTEIHYWPDEWFANQQDITYDAAQFLTSWFNQHAAVATALGKPLLLEEFGKAVNVSSRPLPVEFMFDSSMLLAALHILFSHSLLSCFCCCTCVPAGAMLAVCKCLVHSPMSGTVV